MHAAIFACSRLLHGYTETRAIAMATPPSKRSRNDYSCTMGRESHPVENSRQAPIAQTFSVASG